MSKTTVCKVCGNPLPEGAKVCPNCGAKIKKPFYKRGWFIALVVVLALGVIGTIASSFQSRGDKIDWDSIVLKDVIPKPDAKRGEILINDDDSLSLKLNKVSDGDYQEYISACAGMGFNIESEQSSSSYSAYNQEGYELSLSHYDDEMDIDLDAPMAMGTITWPASSLVRQLPVPKSSYGVISSESSDRFHVYIGKTSMDDFNAYISACQTKGFDVDYEKSETYFNADNAGGYHVSISYEGNQVMSITIDAPEDVPEETPEPEPEETPEPEPEETPEPEENLVDGMRPEFKDAVDSYEAFMDEYIAFMNDYSENPDDLSLIAQYAEMLQKYSDQSEKFDALDDEDMNDAELSYYLEVNTRVLEKLQEVE